MPDIEQSYPQLSSFLEYLQFEKRYSRHTVIAYKNDLEQFFIYVTENFDTPALNQISAGMIEVGLPH